MSAPWPKVDKFLTPHEIVAVLFERLKNAPGVQDFIHEGPSVYHHYLGRDVRNEFHLWHPDNPVTMKDYAPEMRDGVDYNPRHPDNVSGRILEHLHSRLVAYYMVENNDG